MSTAAELQEKEKRYEWLRSQWTWHKRRVNHINGRWHKQQARFYRKAAGKVFTLSDIILRAIRLNSAAMVESVTSNNALLRHLCAPSLHAAT